MSTMGTPGTLGGITSGVSIMPTITLHVHSLLFLNNKHIFFSLFDGSVGINGALNSYIAF